MKGREEQDNFADVDNLNLLVLCFHVYALLDLVSTLSMFTPLLANQFELIPEILHEPFLVNTTIGDSVMVEGVCIEVYGVVESPFEIKLAVSRFKY